ncbi:SHOCT domain-containing protein [Thiomicrorhabdus indica]|uniref:SHOCT domain-containing protein n=1 Tax=Thiomicrorhabdus indica TaxID=2267253 RepID=UPI002AA8C204|nr:SHOCT domain-containing protein [Thiomicrorhabdus indica]
MGISIWQFIFLLILLPLAFLPTIIALKKNHPHKIPIILVNIFGGLLWGLGWLVAIVWCFIVPNENSTNVSSNNASEIETLFALLEKGALTQEEFDSKKRALLER